jgi:hypothetical protein
MNNGSLKRAAFSSMYSVHHATREENAAANWNTRAAAVFVVSNVCDQFRGRLLFRYLMVFLLQGSLVLWVQGAVDDEFGLTGP